MFIFALLSVGMVAGFYAGYKRFKTPKTKVAFDTQETRTCTITVPKITGNIVLPVARFTLPEGLSIKAIYKPVTCEHWRKLIGRYTPCVYKDGNDIHMFPPYILPVDSDKVNVGVEIFRNGEVVSRETGTCLPYEWEMIVSKALMNVV